MSESCAVIVAEFVWGPKRCGEPAVATTEDHDGDSWPICAEHAESRPTRT